MKPLQATEEKIDSKIIALLRNALPASLLSVTISVGKRNKKKMIKTRSTLLRTITPLHATEEKKNGS